MDFETSADGDLVIEQGDFVITDEAQATMQEIIFRVKTDVFDYQPNQQVGAGIDQFRGMPNTRETGIGIERATVRSLTQDGRFQQDQISVQVVPMGIHTVALYVFATPQFTGVFAPVRVSFDIDLALGDITGVTGVVR